MKASPSGGPANGQDPILIETDFKVQVEMDIDCVLVDDTAIGKIEGIRL